MIHKTITILTTLLFLLALLTPVYAAENSARLMVTDCSVSEGGLSAGKEATLYITIKNQSVSADADYCKLTFSEASGDILPVGTGTQYVDCIKAHDTYIWELPVSVASNAADGTHTVEVRIAFTQPDGSSDSAEDSLRVQVEQAVDLEVGSVGVPGEVVSGDMANFSFTALNTGKSTLYGVTMTVTVDGAGTVGKDSLGTLSAGSSGTGSISFSTDDFIVSARAGTVTFTAETANGEEVTASERYYFTIVSEEEGDAEAMDESDRSQPRLMVASYIIQDEALSPGAEKKVSVTLVNTHADKDVYNLKLSFNSESDGITCRGMGTQYLEKLEAGESYVWEIYLTAAHTAQSGLHTATVQVEYEDSEGSAYSASDTLRLPRAPDRAFGMGQPHLSRKGRHGRYRYPVLDPAEHGWGGRVQCACDL